MSSLTMQAAVQQFHEAVGHPVADTPQARIPDDRRVLRMRLITEEFAEVIMALMGAPSEIEEMVKTSLGTLLAALAKLGTGEINLPDLARQIADLHYVVSGTSVEFGIPEKAVFEEVHAANMRKVGGPRREDDKQQRPEGWEPPNIQVVLDNAMRRGV